MGVCQHTTLTDKGSVKEKQNFYNKTRQEFNDEMHPFGYRTPQLFLFLNRTCFNGLIRYNKNGEFNTPYHLNRDGIKPDKLNKIIDEWHALINKHDVKFICQDYRLINPTKNDFVYCDPPYNNTKGMYGGGFDSETFLQWLNLLGCGYALSYDGKTTNKDYTVSGLNEKLSANGSVVKHMYLESGNSSFRRLKTTNKKTVVKESLYVKVV